MKRETLHSVETVHPVHDGISTTTVLTIIHSSQWDALGLLSRCPSSREEPVQFGVFPRCEFLGVFPPSLRRVPCCKIHIYYSANKVPTSKITIFFKIQCSVLQPQWWCQSKRPIWILVLAVVKVDLLKKKKISIPQSKSPVVPILLRSREKERHYLLKVEPSSLKRCTCPTLMSDMYIFFRGTFLPHWLKSRGI